jgi:uncharacterized protein YdaT
VQNECDILRSENAKLERSNQLLTSRMSQKHDAGPNDVGQAPKRKAPTASAARVCKRPKTSQQKSVEQSVDETQEAIEANFDFLDGLGTGEPLLFNKTTAFSPALGLSSVTPIIHVDQS